MYPHKNGVPGDYPVIKSITTKTRKPTASIPKRVTSISNSLIMYQHLLADQFDVLHINYYSVG